MSLATQLATACRASQRILAQLAGMSQNSRGNTLIAGAKVVGVYGPPRVQEISNHAGGFRRLVELDATFTRDQFTAAPQSQTTLVRIDCDPNQTYRISSVDTHDPLLYVLTLAKVGA